MNEYGMKRVPDYTEMAYKEAVSKLRYFLSGNSAPSVSYLILLLKNILKLNQIIESYYISNYFFY